MAVLCCWSSQRGKFTESTQPAIANKPMAKDYPVNEPATAAGAVNEPAAEVAFDTLAAAAELQQADFSPKQATGVVRVITDSQRNLATKGDIRELKGDIRRLDGRLDAMDDKLEGINHRIDGVDAKIEGINHRIDGVDAKIGSLRMIMFVLVSVVLANFALTVTVLMKPTHIHAPQAQTQTQAHNQTQAQTQNHQNINQQRNLTQ